MLQYMLDTNVCIYVIKNYPAELRERFNRLAEQLCISSITLAESHYGAEKSGRRLHNLQAIEHFAARLEVLPFTSKAAAHYGQSAPSWNGQAHLVVRTTCRSVPMRGAKG
jgi:tRNA(fMet)-specific endonuclease VapC